MSPEIAMPIWSSILNTFWFALESSFSDLFRAARTTCLLLCTRFTRK